MNETYTINELRGTDTTIEWVSITIQYEEDGFTAGHSFEVALNASLPSTASDEEIINEGLSALGQDRYLSEKEYAEDFIAAQKQKASNHTIHRADQFSGEIGNNDSLATAIPKVIRFARQKMNEHLESGVEVELDSGTFVYDSARSSMNLLDHARLDADLRPDAWEQKPKRWRMSDGTWITLSVDDVEVIRAKLADHLEACFEWFEGLEQAAMQCTTIDELKAVKQQAIDTVP